MFLFGCFFCVKHASDAALVVELQCASYGGITICEFWVTDRDVRFEFPRWFDIRGALRDPQQCSISSSVTFIPANADYHSGTLATSIAVGFYSGAERVIKALLNLITPISQSPYPRIQSPHHDRSARADIFHKTQSPRNDRGASGLGLGAAFCAPLLVRIRSGRDTRVAVPAWVPAFCSLPSLLVLSWEFSGCCRSAWMQSITG